MSCALHEGRPRQHVAARCSRLLLLLLALLVSASCSEPQEDAAPTATSSPDPSRAALVGLAQSHHVQADLAVERGDLAAAEAHMRELVVELQARRDMPDALELGLDAYTRLCRILVDQARPQDALAVTDEAIAFGGQDLERSIFGGYLYQTRGNIQRTLGDDAGTIASHRKAIEIFKALLDARRPARATDPESPSPR